MKLLADVNIDRLLVVRLRAAGHEVLWMTEINRQMRDPAILKLGWREGAIILTNDADFQRLILDENQPTHGVIWLRLGLARMSRLQRVDRAFDAIQSSLPQLAHNFTTIHPDHVEHQPIAPPTT